ncbi:DNA adenine methylase [Lactococcus taiwanensis]|uniref:site-specific DNA-methyltransferase (adenine-specific) n=1 Tax=Lactococcus taiwanensis TaxID=1151742 RepID=A0AA45KHG4_9LACT|nr:DNA adenine methylase [Lactococcus taiwanensis]QSE77344.1 DNA adenine methylase [Lactococcus taiwanensis]
MQNYILKSKYNAKYPKVNYIGNKEKLSEWIVQNLPVEDGKVLDVFSGGNSVSFELKKQGFQVYSNDILYASFVVGKAIIENNSVQLKEDVIDKALNYKITEEQRQKFVWLENKLYFPEEVDELAQLVSYSETLDDYNKYLFQALIRRSMIRKLPYSRMNVPWNNIVKLRDEEYSYTKYGRKRAYHNAKFSDHIRTNLYEYNAAVFDNGLRNKAFQLDALDAIEEVEKVDVIYLDPPYPSTMNKYDDFYGAFDKVFGHSKNHINLTDKAVFLENLEQVIEVAVLKTKYIVLSLNSRSKPGIDEICEVFSKYGEVTVLKHKHNYQVSGKENKNDNFELLATLKVF